MEGGAFETSVFINCPFDDEYEAILQAVLFCVIYLGFFPMIASQRSNAAENRLSKISDLIRASKYSIHDLSRSQAISKGQLFRLNMPFELGLDLGCRTYGGQPFDTKKVLVLEEKKYRYQAALSDIAGCDIETHGGAYDRAIGKVRNWLVNEAGAEAVGTTRIVQKYIDFGEWYWERQLAAGSSETDIKEYPTSEVLSAMQTWIELGEPLRPPAA